MARAACAPNARRLALVIDERRALAATSPAAIASSLVDLAEEVLSVSADRDLPRPDDGMYRNAVTAVEMSRSPLTKPVAVRVALARPRASGHGLQDDAQIGD